jgi:hypothetical protein
MVLPFSGILVYRLSLQTYQNVYIFINTCSRLDTGLGAMSNIYINKFIYAPRLVKLHVWGAMSEVLLSSTLCQHVSLKIHTAHHGLRL